MSDLKDRLDARAEDIDQHRGVSITARLLKEAAQRIRELEGLYREAEQCICELEAKLAELEAYVERTRGVTGIAPPYQENSRDE